MRDSYRPDIDGLRAVAVALVVAFHAYPAAVPGGFVGVDVFFVISGYLITGLILNGQATNAFSIGQFYIRRARRILPALAVVIAATLILGGFILLPVPYERLGLHAIAGALFFPNLVYWSEAGYFDLAAKTKPLLHLWSLGVEEQFYLVWPLLLVSLHRMKVRSTTVLTVLTGLSLIYSSIESFYHPAAAFYSPFSRLWELGVGGILAARRSSMIPYRRSISSLGLVLILGAAFKLTQTSPFPGLLALIPVGGTALMIAGGSSFLSSGPLVALGLISYPLYLWHWPLLSYAAMYNFEAALAKPAIIVASVFLAWMTTRYIEYPIRFGTLRSSGAAISLTGNLGVAFAAALIFHFNGLPSEYPADVKRALAFMSYKFHDAARYHRCWLTKDASFDSYGPECRNGRIAVWGDSFSALLSTGLPKPYAQFNRDACLPLIEGVEEQCASSNAAILKELLHIRPERVILFGNWPVGRERWHSGPAVAAALTHTLKVLRSGIDDVILIGPSPLWLPGLPSLVFKFWSESGVMPDRLKLPLQDYRATDTIMSDIAEGQRAGFISIIDAECNVEGCLTHTPASQGELLAWDAGHMTIEGARYIVGKLGLARLDHPNRLRAQN